MAPGGTAVEVANKPTSWTTYIGVIGGLFGLKRLGGSSDEIIEQGTKQADETTDALADFGGKLKHSDGATNKAARIKAVLGLYLRLLINEQAATFRSRAVFANEYQRQIGCLGIPRPTVQRS